MSVALDTTILSLLFDPLVRPPLDPATHKPVERTKDRIDFLVAQLETAGARILIPTPVLAEFLVMADTSGPDYLAELSNRSVFEIVPFDAISAIEAAALQRKAIATGNKKADLKATRQCIKVDRQIVAIAKTRDVTALYTADVDVKKIAAHLNIDVVMLWDMELPPETEPELPLGDPEAGS